jgi:non-heme chloroperoxidase
MAMAESLRVDRGDTHVAGDRFANPGRPLVILSPGGGQTRHSWRGAAERLHEIGFEIISLDLRGHGDSGWPKPEGYHSDYFAGDLLEVASRFGAGRKIGLVGASFGGLMSLFAAGHGSTVAIDAVVLVDVVPRVEMQGADRIRDFMLANSRSGFATLEEASHAIADFRGTPRTGDTAGLERNLRCRDDGRWYWHWDPNFVDSVSTPRGRQDRIEAAVQAYGGPLMLLRGVTSEVVGPEGVAALRAVAPHMEYLDVADAGHMIVNDKNDAFIAATADFLRRHLG